MTFRKIDEVATDLDDASTTVEELQADSDADTSKLDELHDTLEHASDAIDAIENGEDMAPKK